jgi:hypothetical protein
MTDLATLQARLGAAEAALHDLMTGAKRVTVERNGTKIVYNQTSITELRRYIAELKSQIAAAGGGGARRGILNAYF